MKDLLWIIPVATAVLAAETVSVGAVVSRTVTVA